MRSGKTWVFVVVAVLLAAAATWQGRCWAQGDKKPPASGMTIGVVDVARVFNQCKRRADFVADLMKRQQGIKQKAQKWREKIKGMEFDRDEFRPNSPEYAKKNREILNETVQFSAWQKIEQVDMQIQQKLTAETVYKEIIAESKKQAKQRGLSLVLAADDFPIESKDIRELQAKIRQKRVLYSSPQLSLTDAILQAINARYTAGQTKSE